MDSTNRQIQKVVETYKRIKTYRPDLNEESSLLKVQKTLLKDHCINLTREDIRKIIENCNLNPYKTVLKRPVLIKRDTTKGNWCKKVMPNERKREYKQICENFYKIDSINTSTPMKEKREFKSKIPRPITKLDFNQKSNNYSNRNSINNSSIFERLYENRTKPCSHKIEHVRYIREVWTAKSSTNNIPSPIKCPYHEPPNKKTRYSKECLQDSNQCVFERLYAERKQFNRKKLTDLEKRELHLKKQQEERKKLRATRVAKNSISNSLITENSISENDGDTDELIELESTLVADSKESKAEKKNIQELLDKITDRFHEHMSLCPVHQSDYMD